MGVKMLRKLLFTLFMLIGGVFSASCSPNQISPTPEANMPNPASVYCEQNGGKLDLRQDISGGVAGVCIFPDGSECDEWAYFRGECKPGDAPESSESTPTSTAELASDGWKIFRNEQLGYSFHYPVDANVSSADDPLRAVSIIGPVTGNDNWPVIYVSHPSDREEYRPPEGVDLEQWLIDHNLWTPDDPNPVADRRQPDVQIAGTTAIHIRHERSPQSYADDKYYCAESGQLYVVVILHAGDREDWALYNHFLESIQFES